MRVTVLVSLDAPAAFLTAPVMVPPFGDTTTSRVPATALVKSIASVRTSCPAKSRI